MKQFTTSIVFCKLYNKFLLGVTRVFTADLRVANKGQTLANVTISPKKCCLIIDQDDCEVRNTLIECTPVKIVPILLFKCR